MAGGLGKGKILTSINVFGDNVLFCLAGGLVQEHVVVVLDLAKDTVIPHRLQMVDSFVLAAKYVMNPVIRNRALRML